MTLAELGASLTPRNDGRFDLAFGCPRCGMRVEIPVRLGLYDPAGTWGISSTDLGTMSVVPSIANPRHGRIICPAHFTIDAGTINMR